jgi:hypothetical protein
LIAEETYELDEIGIFDRKPNIEKPKEEIFEGKIIRTDNKGCKTMTKKSRWVIILVVISLMIIILGCVFFPSEEQQSLEETETKTLFYENFENGSQDWNLEEGWSLEKIDNNTVLKGSGHKWATLKNRSWDNYTFKAKFKLIQGTIHFNYRRSISNGHNRYFIGISTGELYLNKQIGDKFYSFTNIHIIANTGINLENQWHEIEIIGYSDIINISLDGKLYVVYKDENPILAGGIAFETLEESVSLIDYVEIKKNSTEDIVTEPTPEQISGSSFVPDITHSGHLVVEGKETKIIEDVKYFQQGNIYVNNEAKLIVRNSQLMIGSGEVVPTVHCYIFVDDNASLEIENSTIFPRDGLVVVRTSGKVNITNSPTEIHLLEIYEGAKIIITDSEMVGPIGGLIQIGSGGYTRIINSTIGALGLRVPANAHLNISGLESGVYFESWDVHDMIPEADYTLVLEKTRILKDDFKGELKHGPYERGWLFFLDPNAHVRISNSELRKVFIDLINEDVVFENLRVGIPSSLNYRDIKLRDVIIMGQWPFTIMDSNVTIKNSDYLFLQTSGQSTVTLINSHVCEFIPRDFFGTITFENGLWTTAGEIIGGVPYHSMKNNFTLKGSLKINRGVRDALRWKDAWVTREYDVIVKDESSNPIEGTLIKIDGKTFVSDNAGKAKFSSIFNEFNYNEPKNLEVLEGENLITQKEIDFFTETPIIIIKD